MGNLTSNGTNTNRYSIINMQSFCLGLQQLTYPVLCWKIIFQLCTTYHYVGNLPATRFMLLYSTEKQKQTNDGTMFVL